MKVLYLLNNFSIGGAETGLLHLIRHGFFAGMELEIAVLFEGTGKLKAKLPEAGFSGKATALRKQADMSVPLLFSAYKKLVTLLKASQPDLLLLSLPQANILGRIAARHFPKMKVATFEHTARFGKPYYGPLLRLTSPRVDAVLYDSEVTATAMRKYYSGKERLWKYVPLVCVAPGQPAKRHYTAGETLSIFSAGRLSPPKNYPEALKAIALLLKRGHKVHYFIAGEGSMRAELEALAQSLGIAEHVSFLGFIDWKPWQQKADIFLQASSWEGLCISVIEAMGAAMPVVATDVGGMRDYGQDGRNMVKSAPDAASIAGALEKLLRSEELRHTLGQQAHADITARFGQAIVEQQLQEGAKALKAIL